MKTLKINFSKENNYMSIMYQTQTLMGCVVTGRNVITVSNFNDKDDNVFLGHAEGKEIKVEDDETLVIQQSNLGRNLIIVGTIREKEGNKFTKLYHITGISTSYMSWNPEGLTKIETLSSGIQQVYY